MVVVEFSHRAAPATLRAPRGQADQHLGRVVDVVERTAAERFWVKADRSGGPDACWAWTRHQSKSRGYGRFRLDGKSEEAHRVAWRLTYGPIPDGLCVLHRCDNRPCVNPKHLFLGTIADNQADMVAKGRSPRGERQGRSKLTAEQVHAIRRALADGVTQKELARQYGCSPSNIGLIRHGTNWSWLKEREP
jgi:hypothetical protein